MVLKFMMKINNFIKIKPNSTFPTAIIKIYFFF